MTTYSIYRLSGVRADIVCCFCKKKEEIKAERSNDFILPLPWRMFDEESGFWCGTCDPRKKDSVPVTATEQFLSAELEEMGYKKLAKAFYHFDLKAVHELRKLVERVRKEEKK